MGQGYTSSVVHPPLTPPSREGDLGFVSSDADFFQDRFDNAVGIGEDIVVPPTASGSDEG